MVWSYFMHHVITMMMVGQRPLYTRLSWNHYHGLRWQYTTIYYHSSLIGSTFILRWTILRFVLTTASSSSGWYPQSIASRAKMAVSLRNNRSCLSNCFSNVTIVEHSSWRRCSSSVGNVVVGESAIGRKNINSITALMTVRCTWMKKVLIAFFDFYLPTM